MKTLVTGALKATEAELRELEDLGLELGFHEDEHLPVEKPEQYEAAIGLSLFYYQDPRAFTSLRYNQVLSVGLDRQPLAYFREKGITVHNVGGAFAVPMAEWTLMSLLSLYKRQPLMEERQRSHLWKRDYGWRELDGKKTVLLGYGDFGREIEKRLIPFGLELTVVNRTLRESPFGTPVLPLTALGDALKDADILILAIAGTGETKGIIGREELALLKPSAVLINGARGSLVDQAALFDALNGDRLAGAALDVFEKEPLQADDPAWEVKNLLITPHNCFAGEGNHERIFRIVVKNLKNYLKL